MEVGELETRMSSTRIERVAKSTVRALASSRVYTLPNGFLGLSMFV